jgi:hypothetical protein
MSTLRRISVFTLAAVGLAAGAYAQTGTPPLPTTVTSGVIAAAQGQVARLNALNPGVAPPAIGVVCAAQLTFLDSNGKVLKTAMVSVTPGDTGAIALDGDTDLKLLADERRELRATISSTCELIGTVEIFDKFTGRTQAVLGGMHKVPSPVAATPSSGQ